MNKWISFLCYGIAFLLISGTVFRLILYVPPVPGNSNFELFAILSAIFSILVSALIVGLFVKKDRG